MLKMYFSKLIGYLSNFFQLDKLNNLFSLHLKGLSPSRMQTIVPTKSVLKRRRLDSCGKRGKVETLEAQPKRLN